MFRHVGFFRFYVNAEHHYLGGQFDAKLSIAFWHARNISRLGFLVMSVFAYSLVTGVSQAQQPTPPSPPAGIVPDQLPPNALGKEYSGRGTGQPGALR